MPDRHRRIIRTMVHTVATLQNNLKQRGDTINFDLLGELEHTTIAIRELLTELAMLRAFLHHKGISADEIAAFKKAYGTL